MKNLFLILTIAIVLFSCTKEPEPMGIPGPDLFLEISIFSPTGVDLLNPDNPESFDYNSIGYYYIENGQEYSMYDQSTLEDGTPKYHNPKGFIVYERKGSYIVSPQSHRTSTGYAEYLFKWDSENSDTVKCEYKVDNSITRISKVWHNQTVVWDETTYKGTDGRYFKIIRR